MHGILKQPFDILVESNRGSHASIMMPTPSGTERPIGYRGDVGSIRTAQCL